MIDDLRIAFNLRLVEAGSSNWFHFNFRKPEQGNHHLHSGGYSVRIEAHSLRLVAGSNQTLLSVNLRNLLGSDFSFTNSYSRVEITAVGESLSVSVNGVEVLDTNLRTLNEPLYVESGMINFFNAASRGAYSMNTISLKIHEEEFTSTYADWATASSLSGAQAAKDADPDGDGMDNFTEYVFGGDPNLPDADSVLPGFSLITINGQDFIEYIYNRRTDNPALSYDLKTNTDLLNGVWNSVGDDYESATESLGDNIESVTNLIPILENRKFIRLEVNED